MLRIINQSVYWKQRAGALYRYFTRTLIFLLLNRWGCVIINRNKIVKQGRARRNYGAYRIAKAVF